MNDLKSLCTTCLSNVEDGSANISEPMCNFLRNELSFKCPLDQRSSKLVCRDCYKTLIELRRFCTQLRDVELYFQTKSKSISDGVDNDQIVMEPESISLKLHSKVNNEKGILIGSNSSDAIMIKSEETMALVEIRQPTMAVKRPLTLPKPIDSPLKTDNNTVKRLVCLTCNKLFSSINDLQTHERSHAAQTNNTIIKPVFMPTSIAPTPPKQKKMSCPVAERILVRSNSIDPIRIEPEKVITMDNPTVELRKQSTPVKTPLKSPNASAGGTKIISLIYNKSNRSINVRESSRTESINNTIEEPVSGPINTNTTATAQPKQKKLSCTECGLRFELTKALITHLKVHEYERLKPYKCGQCNWRFSNENSLRDHELIHIDVEMCVCEICQKKYYNESSLEAHMRVAHNCTADNVTGE